MTAEEETAMNRWGNWPWVREVDWDAVYVEQLPRVYNYFRFRLGRHIDVEDLTSRTFEKAWRARSQYRRDLAGFSTWLFGIAHNVVTDYLRSRHNELSIDVVFDELAAETVEDEAERDSDIARLARLTAVLSERDQELLALKYGATLNNRMIAKLTGLSESNVGTRLHRMVEKLRSQW